MRKILIVDDHADIRRLFSVTLGHAFDLIEARTADEALPLVHQHLPDLVLLDIMMPGKLNGLSLLQIIKSEPLTRHIKVAMVTACGQAADQQAAESLGADAYFIKPFSPKQILNWIQEQIR